MGFTTAQVHGIIISIRLALTGTDGNLKTKMAKPLVPI